LTFLYKIGDRVTTRIDVDIENKKILNVENYTNISVQTAFGKKDKVTYGDFESLLESRCFPRTRDMLEDHLRALSLSEYDPLEIVKKTEGRMHHDNISLIIAG